MLYAGGLIGAVLVLLWLFCIIDVIVTPAEECRYLPKLVWLGLVILLGDIGSAAWLLAGRPWPHGSPLERLAGGGARRRDSGWERSAPSFPEYDRPGRFAATNPDDDDAFLQQVRERAEAQRRTESARRRESERIELTERETRRQSDRTTQGDHAPGSPDSDRAARSDGSADVDGDPADERPDAT